MLFILSLQLPAVQTYLTQRIAQYLGQELQANITLERIYFKPFSTLSLQKFAVVEYNGDTTLYAKSLHSKVNLRSFFKDKVIIEEIKLEEGFLNYEIFPDSNNLSKYVHLFNKPTKSPKKKSKKLEVRLDKIELINNTFRMLNHKYKYPRKGMNFANLYVTNISSVIDHIQLDSLKKAQIHNLTLKEKSGFLLKELTAKVSWGTKTMAFEDLIIRTNRSVFQNQLIFKYEHFKDFEDFIHKVRVESTIQDSYVDSKDIAFFAPDVASIDFIAEISKAELSGTVAHIHAKNARIKTGKNTLLEADFRIVGLPNIDKTIFDFNIQHLTTNAKDIEAIVPPLSKLEKLILPQKLHTLQQISYKGNLIGLYNDFDVKGNLSTALGNLSTQIHLNLKNKISYTGAVKTNLFQLGKFITQPTIGNAAFDINLDGAGLTFQELSTLIKGNIQYLAVKNYTYRNILASGSLQNKELTVSGNINDPNLQLTYRGVMDWKPAQPVYNIESNISYASPNRLAWINKDSVIIHAAILHSDFQGNSLNTLSGTVTAHNLQFATTKGDFLIDDISFSATGNENNRKLDLQSDVLDINLQGTIDLNTVVPYFKSLAMRYAPAINIDNPPYNPQNFDLSVRVKSFKPISALLDPNIILDDGAQLQAQFSSEDYTAQFVAHSPTISYKGVKINNLKIIENADQKAFSLNINADRINFGDSTYINNIALNNVLAKDSLLFNIVLSEPQATNYLNLNGDIYFTPNKPADIHFRPSQIIINRENWSLNDNAQVHVSKGKMYVEDLILSQNKQQIKLNGILSNQQDKLKVLFNNFSLASLQGITKPLGIHLNGDLDGEVDITSVFYKPLASANIRTSPILYNEVPVGKLDLKADFEPVSGAVLIDLKLLDELKRGVIVDGRYNIYDENEPLLLKGHLKETDLSIFQPFLKNLVSNLNGKGNANVDIKGTFKNPKITGLGKFTDASFTVNYLNTHYYVDNQTAMVENNAIMLQNMSLRDSKGNKALANGLVNLQKLANPYIDVDISANRFMILNTSFKDNNLYFGTAYATGTFKFVGYTSAINIDINAKSESGTLINLPFNSAMTVSDTDFIYFVSSDSIENQKRDSKRLLRGLTMNMDLNFTPDALVNLQTSMGSLKGNGTGNINMKISSLGDFEMFGDYIVREGKFHFTAQDFINKYFDIKEGGTIRWTGNPAEAVINLNAIYQQRTAIGPLYNAAGHSGENERVLAQADMLIKGTLDQPDVTFDLNFPQNPYIKDQLQSYLSDANNVNQQALSLIVRRSFTPSSTSEIGREVNNTLLSAGTEIAFNQLNNILSQSLNMNFLDLNIRSFNDASASVRLLNDRLVLSGGITDRSNYDATDLTFFRQGVTTDAELTFKLRNDGNLLFRAYNRPYTRNFLIRSTDAEYISAIGLVYRQEFNSLGEFWKRLWLRNLKKTDSQQ